MIVFTTLSHFERRGTATGFVRACGKDYKLVLIDRRTTEEVRRLVRPALTKRLLATIPSRDQIVLWLRQHDVPAKPWPKYAIEGV